MSYLFVYLIFCSLIPHIIPFLVQYTLLKYIGSVILSFIQIITCSEYLMVPKYVAALSNFLLRFLGIFVYLRQIGLIDCVWCEIFCILLLMQYIINIGYCSPMSFCSLSCFLFCFILFSVFCFQNLNFFFFACLFSILCSFFLEILVLVYHIPLILLFLFVAFYCVFYSFYSFFEFSDFSK